MSSSTWQNHLQTKQEIIGTKKLVIGLQLSHSLLGLEQKVFLIVPNYKIGKMIAPTDAKSMKRLKLITPLDYNPFHLSDDACL